MHSRNSRKLVKRKEKVDEACREEQSHHLGHLHLRFDEPHLRVVAVVMIRLAHRSTCALIPFRHPLIFFIDDHDRDRS